MISDAIRDVIVANPAAVASLATYPFTTGLPEPAVFTCERIPDDCGYPAVIIDDGGGTPWGTRCKRGAEAALRARVYGDKNWTLSRVRDVAWHVNRAIDRAALDPHLATYGYRAALCQADPPAYLPDPDGFPGYVIGVRVIVLRA